MATTTKEWKNVKELGQVKLGDKTALKATVDTDGSRYVLNFREYVNGTTPTRKGIALDMENEEAMLLIYNALAVALDKPAKKATPVPVVEDKPALSRNAKKKLARMGVKA